MRWDTAEGRAVRGGSEQDDWRKSDGGGQPRRPAGTRPLAGAVPGVADGIELAVDVIVDEIGL